MTEFFRLSGGGNDFLALVEPGARPSPADVRAWCRRGLSLGADGLFLLSRRAGGAAMEHFNPDGEAAALCLNGTRCAARLAFHLGWAAAEVEILTGAGPVAAREAGPDRIELAVPPPEEGPRAVTVELDETSFDGSYVRFGVPHFVLPWPAGLGGAPVAALGPRLRRHPAFGDPGANVDFVRWPDRHRLEIRTYERGVEAETLACGTGVLAAVAAALDGGGAELPVAALTRGGFELAVDGAPRRGRPRRWTLTGDARLVAAGAIFAAAAALPEPPPW